MRSALSEHKIARTNDFRVLVVMAAAALAAGLLMLVAAEKSAKAAFPGANGLIAFVSDRDSNDEIYVMNADGSNPIPLTNTPGGTNINEMVDQFPAVSPNGKEIAFASNRPVTDPTTGITTTDFEIYVMDAKDDNGDGQGDNLRRLTNDAADEANVAWSPGSKKIAFTGSQDGDGDVYVMDANGAEPINLTNNSTAFDGQPVFSPDGTKIAFLSRRDGNNEIYVMNADGSDQTNLTKNTASDSQPDFSPNGTQIAFTSTRPALDGTTDFDVWVVDANGSGTPTNLTNALVIRDTTTPTQDRYPAWSPDGTKIAFWSQTGPPTGFIGADIWVMDVNGNNPTNLTHNEPGVGDIQPDWGPTPKK